MTRSVAQLLKSLFLASESDPDLKTWYVPITWVQHYWHASLDQQLPSCSKRFVKLSAIDSYNIPTSGAVLLVGTSCAWSVRIGPFCLLLGDGAFDELLMVLCPASQLRT